MKNYRCLSKFPSNIEMQSLQVLNFSGCCKLKKFPEVKGNMERLAKLYLDGTDIEQLPLSIERLTDLDLLNLNNCKSLISLPSSFCDLNSLKTLTVSGCLKLGKLPEQLGNVECLEELDMSGTTIRMMAQDLTVIDQQILYSCKPLQMIKEWKDRDYARE
ncbi:hypothetical protein RCOM_0740580 [Ricinus communis]|uniref:Disease resistance R13L4/SHOC-2-like LRR domain-containing protein n=1 Tax=Ricinus communis TaxID=3988 RepID=B9SHM0_RICCO|nr:hypothetical protein RCOM_0740580 [Ricinus communis]